MHQLIAYFKHYTAVCLTQNDPKKGGAGFRPDQSYIEKAKDYGIDVLVVDKDEEVDNDFRVMHGNK
eukprot:scaffold199906_cov35-Attheya_sp.AAC.1